MITWLEQHRKITFTLTILVAILIYYVSSIQSIPGNGTTGINLSVPYHTLIFFTLTLLTLITLQQKNKRYLGITLLLLLFYAISDEYHQLFVPGRNGSLGDLLIDSTGILLATLFYQKTITKE